MSGHLPSLDTSHLILCIAFVIVQAIELRERKVIIKGNQILLHLHFIHKKNVIERARSEKEEGGRMVNRGIEKDDLVTTSHRWRDATQFIVETLSRRSR
jgi:hypothetical protein